MLVVQQLDVLKDEIIDPGDGRIEAQRRQGEGRTGELLAHLIQMVEIEVAIPACPDEIARFEAGDLGHHVCQQGIGGDVEGHAEERVGAALVELAGQLPIRDVELEQTVAGRGRWSRRCVIPSPPRGPGSMP